MRTPARPPLDGLKVRLERSRAERGDKPRDGFLRETFVLPRPDARLKAKEATLSDLYEHAMQAQRQMLIRDLASQTDAAPAVRELYAKLVAGGFSLAELHQAAQQVPR